MPAPLLLALDLDGTTLNRDRELPESNRVAIQKVQEAGVEVVLASGRMILSIMEFAEQIGGRCHFVSSNGAYVRSADGEVVHHEPLDSGVLSSLIDYANHREATYNLYAVDRVLSGRESEWLDLYRQRLRTISPQIADPKTQKSTIATKLMFIGPPSTVQIYARELREILVPGTYEMVFSEPEYLEFLAPGQNKARGLSALAGHLGFAPQNCAAIGDYLNDLEMIQWAGISGAVANAHPDVLRSAQKVYADHDSGGVSEFIEDVFRAILSQKAAQR